MNRFYLFILLLITLLLLNVNAQDFWKFTNGPTENAKTYSIAINSKDHIFAGTQLDGIFYSSDNGESWIEINKGWPSYCDETYCPAYSFAINSDSYIFAASEPGVWRSTDNGANWTVLNNGIYYNAVLSISVNPDGYIFAGTYDFGIYRSTNNGNSWTESSNGLPHCNVTEIFYTICPINFIAINSAKNIFVGTRGGGVYSSTSNGDNWTQSSNGITDNRVTSLAINSRGHIFAGTNRDGVFLSTDDGDNWIQKSNGLPQQVSINKLAINSSDHVFAGTGGFGEIGEGIFLSTDDGKNWTQINSGLKSKNIYSLAVNSKGYIFVGTDEGVFRSIDPTTSVNDKETEAPSEFSLGQNYPNPFNPLTTISYTIPKRSYVTIKVYDILSNKVKTLVNETKHPGSYEVEFDGSGLSSGTFIYTMTTGSYHTAKKLLLLK